MLINNTLWYGLLLRSVPLENMNTTLTVRSMNVYKADYPASFRHCLTNNVIQIAGVQERMANACEKPNYHTLLNYNALTHTGTTLIVRQDLTYSQLFRHESEWLISAIICRSLFVNSAILQRV